ncbi:MAG: RpiB/LacA/LacB family sugar-phosphate isomerase [Holosporales bacterium]|nr:RpiB/LacA/LacB family sugar-phosphate isomerase [Holosporales bacterium]
MIFESIAIAADHRGYLLKTDIMRYVASVCHDVVDYGTRDDSTPVDYPDYAALVATHVQKHAKSFGILICNSGVGMAIAANKFRGIRAVFCDKQEIASLSREHNDANIICFGSAFTSPERTVKCIEIFSATSSLKEERHSNRIKKIDRLTG